MSREDGFSDEEKGVLMFLALALAFGALLGWLVRGWIG